MTGALSLEGSDLFSLLLLNNLENLGFLLLISSDETIHL